MKLIILEGGDRLGKSTLIKGLCEYFNYDNMSIRHFGKPPKDLTPKDVLEFQFSMFEVELNLFYQMNGRDAYKYNYYPEIMLWNRSHLGEYVYSQMFRGGNAKELKERLIEYEKGFISHEVYLITLTADPEFFNSRKSDGHELSKTLDEKTRELELFKEAHDFSIIANKHLLKVDQAFDLTGTLGWSFRTKEDILSEVIDFIK